jgi:hypothetical protein
MPTAAVKTSDTATAPSKQVRSAPPFALTSVRTGHKWLKILAYGKHGAGKTTLAASAVDSKPMNDVLMIMAESGTLVLEDNERIKHVDEISLVEVDNFKQVVKMYEFLSAHCKFRDEGNVDKMKEVEAWLRGVDPKDIKKPKQFRTVIIDSLTEIEAYCLYGLLGIHGEFDMAQIDDDMKTAEFAEYKKNNNMVNLLVRAFRDLPMNVIVLCAETWSQDEMKRFHYGPALTGKLRTQVQGYFDIVGYLAVGAASESGDAPRRLYIQPVGKWDAKNRRASFKESFFEDPTMGSILKDVGLMQD